MVSSSGSNGGCFLKKKNSKKSFERERGDIVFACCAYTKCFSSLERGKDVGCGGLIPPSDCVKRDRGGECRVSHGPPVAEEERQIVKRQEEHILQSVTVYNPARLSVLLLLPPFFPVKYLSTLSVWMNEENKRRGTRVIISFSSAGSCHAAVSSYVFSL